MPGPNKHATNVAACACLFQPEEFIKGLLVAFQAFRSHLSNANNKGNGYHP